MTPEYSQMLIEARKRILCELISIGGESPERVAEAVLLAGAHVMAAFDFLELIGAGGGMEALAKDMAVNVARVQAKEAQIN
jgi:hypothetical protein